MFFKRRHSRLFAVCAFFLLSHCGLRLGEPAPNIPIYKMPGSFGLLCSQMDYKKGFSSYFAEDRDGPARGQNVGQILHCMAEEIDRAKNLIAHPFFEKQEMINFLNFLNTSIIKTTDIQPVIGHITHPDYFDGYISIKNSIVDLIEGKPAGSVRLGQAVCQKKEVQDVAFSKRDADALISFLRNLSDFFIQVEQKADSAFERFFKSRAQEFSKAHLREDDDFKYQFLSFLSDDLEKDFPFYSRFLKSALIGKKTLSPQLKEESAPPSEERAGVLTAGDGNSAFTAEEGISALTVREGNSAFTAGEGISAFIGGEGISALTGKEGISALTAKDGNSAFTAGEGISALTGKEGTVILTAGEGISALTVREGNSAFTGEEGSNVLTGKEGTGALTAKEGSSVFTAGEGASALTAKEGSSVFTAGEGASALTAKEKPPAWWKFWRNSDSQTEELDSAFQPLWDMAQLPLPSSERLTAQNIKYIMLNIYITNSLFAVYDINQDSVLNPAELELLSCVLTPLVSPLVLSQLDKLNGLPQQIKKLIQDFYDPKAITNYIIKYQKLPPHSSKDIKGMASFLRYRMWSDPDSWEDLSYTDASRLISVLILEAYKNFY